MTKKGKVLTPSPQHLKEAGECVERSLIETARTSTNIYPIPKTLIDEIAQALCLSESRGVKKGMMRAADIAKKVGCEPCGDIIAQAIRTKAESEEG